MKALFKHLLAKPITSVLVAGAGGTGSIFVSHLCRIACAWEKLGGQRLQITIADPDVVTEANLARQVFCEADIGQNKALVLAQRMRSFYGLDIDGRGDEATGSWGCDVIVGCVDTIKARRRFRPMVPRDFRYWLDLGNDANVGQVILGGQGLPDFFDLHPKARDKKTTPSCSLAEALERQDLFINSTVASFGGQLLWQLMRRGGIDHHGYYINLGTGRVAPIPVPEPQTIGNKPRRKGNRQAQ